MAILAMIHRLHQWHGHLGHDSWALMLAPRVVLLERLNGNFMESKIEKRTDSMDGIMCLFVACLVRKYLGGVGNEDE